MHFRKYFFKYFFLVVSFFAPIKSDLPDQLTALKGRLNGLKGKLIVLKDVLGKLKDELSKKNEFDLLTKTINANPDKKISELDLPPELKKISIATEKEKDIFQEKVTQTFKSLPEKSLDEVMASILFDKASGDEKKKIVQSAAAQAWVDNLENNLSSNDQDAIKDSLLKFVDGAAVYIENSCTVPIPIFQQPTEFLGELFDSIKNPEASLHELEVITQAKEKEYTKKKLDESAQLTGNQKNKLKNIDKLNEETIITIARAYFTAQPHSLFKGKPNDLDAFKDYLIDQKIDPKKADDIILMLKALNKDSLPELVNKNESTENLAYLNILLDFINNQNLLDTFNNKLNPPPTGFVNLITSFMSGGETKLKEVQERKGTLLNNQKTDIAKLENKAFKLIHEYIVGENRLHTQSAKIDPNNFIVAFEQLEKFETVQQKEKFKKIIKKNIIAHKTVTAFKVKRDDLEQANLTLNNTNPLKFLSENPLAISDQSNFIKSYTLLFINVFRSYAKRSSNPIMQNMRLNAYLEEVFSCFDGVTKSLLFKNKNKILASITEHKALIDKIENNFYEIVEAFYKNQFTHQATDLNDLITLLLFTRAQFLANNFNHFENVLFNDLLNLSQSLCSNITLAPTAIAHLSENESIHLLQKIILILKTVEASASMSSTAQSHIESAAKRLPQLNISLLEAIDDGDTKEQKRATKAINEIEKLLSREKKKTEELVKKYIHNNFDSSVWKPTKQAFAQIADLSLKLNLENNFAALENWDQAIQKNLGSNWHNFLIDNHTARGALRETFNQLKYAQLIENAVVNLFNSIQNNVLIDASELDTIQALFPQYSQHWLAITEKLLHKVPSAGELIVFNTRLANQSQELKNYLLANTYLTKKITKTIQSAARFQHLNDVMNIIKDMPSPLTISTLKQEIPQGSDAWYDLVENIITTKITPSDAGQFIDLIKKPSDLLNYLGGHLFINDVVNYAKKTLSNSVDTARIFIDDPRSKRKS